MDAAAERVCYACCRKLFDDWADPRTHCESRLESEVGRGCANGTQVGSRIVVSRFGWRW